MAPFGRCTRTETPVVSSTTWSLRSTPSDSSGTGIAAIVSRTDTTVSSVRPPRSAPRSIGIAASTAAISGSSRAATSIVAGGGCDMRVIIAGTVGPDRSGPSGHGGDLTPVSSWRA